VKLSRRSSLLEVAAVVGDALRRHRIRAVLTGGACASLHSGGVHQSVDVDFVLSGVVKQADLDRAMASVGFTRHRDRYVHERVPFFIEFPRGPLAIGEDSRVRPIVHRVGALRSLILSATDSCRDRLAAFYHWNDRQSLSVAVAIARRRHVNRQAIRRWSVREGMGERFE
jgi:hypothetical protein